MQADILEMMKDTLAAMRVQTLYLKPPYNDMADIDFGMLKELYGDFDYQLVTDHFIKNCQPDTIYVMKSQFYMYHTFFRFPEKFEKEYGYTLCVIGPILFQPITQSEFSMIIKENHIDEKYIHDLQVFYSRLPYVKSFGQWSSIIISFCKHIFDHEIKLLQDHTPTGSFLTINFNNFTLQPDPNLTSDTIVKRYQAENALMQSVRRGDSVEASLRANEFSKFRILPRHGDSIRDTKNLLIVLNTLLRKAVEDASVHPVYIDELSRKIALEIETCTTASQLENVKSDMVHKYCLLVNNYSRAQYSKLIRKCLDYVDFHYMEPITLKSLADQFYVSNTHLSVLFKKEVNVNLKEYIQDVRLRQARLLLNSTRLPVQEIAVNCGILDVNYFTRVFKKVHGLSPREYRNKVQNIS